MIVADLRKAARGIECQVRIPGVCNHNPETSVLAHIRLPGTCGMGIKPPDLLGAIACSACHDEIDRRTRLRPAGANQATYMLIRDSDNSNIMLVGRSGASYDTVMTNYKYGTSITMTDAWAGCNKGWYGSTIESRSGYLNSKAMSTAANAHLYFINSDNKNRGVIYSRPIANGQLICIRPDNSSTGATGSEMSVNGATGEVRAVKFTNISDERAKFWIKPVESALDKICQLRGVTYSMHTTVQNTVRNAGLIAQDVQKVLPEAVTEYEADKTTIDKECRTIENPLSLDYNALSALYVEAFKEMRAEIDALKAELADMKAKAASLTASGDATISE